MTTNPPTITWNGVQVVAGTNGVVWCAWFHGTGIVPAKRISFGSSHNIAIASLLQQLYDESL